jgi:hypothetical protein
MAWKGISLAAVTAVPIRSKTMPVVMITPKKINESHKDKEVSKKSEIIKEIVNVNRAVRNALIVLLNKRNHLKSKFTSKKRPLKGPDRLFAKICIGDGIYRVKIVA